MNVKAIETRYAGCHFRSRLEARWAVFFDKLGIPWEYEPQGLMVSHRLTLAEGEFAYLPDFWLPGEQLWAEVKGSLTDPECVRLLDAAAHLSSNGGGGCHDSGGHDVLLLGPLRGQPTVGDHLPYRLHMHKGDIYTPVWPTETTCHGTGHRAVATDIGGNDGIFDHGLNVTETATILLAGGWRRTIPASVASALKAARSARFEHGQSGAGPYG